MENNLLDGVKPETLDALLDALCDVLDEMKNMAPDRTDRYRDDGYMACLSLNNAVLLSLKRQVLKGEKIEK